MYSKYALIWNLKARQVVLNAHRKCGGVEASLNYSTYSSAFTYCFSTPSFNFAYITLHYTQHPTTKHEKLDKFNNEIAQWSDKGKHFGRKLYVIEIRF